MPDVSPILALPLIQPAQAQKHVTHNEALRLLDVLVQPVVARRDLTAPPPDPAEGDRHIVGAAPTGAWAGQAQRIALFEGGAWVFLAPQPGWQAQVMQEGVAVVFDGAAWVAPADMVMRHAALGVNTGADGTNRLAVAGPATLFTHAGAGHQVKLNKASLADTAALLFQTGFSGRAEMGLAGQDDFGIKVSADGAAWAEALRIGAATGEARLFQPLRLADGAAAGPGLRFDADGDTGMFRPGPDQVALVAGGVARLTAGATAVEMGVPLRAPAGSAAFPALGFAADTDTGLFRVAENQLGLATGGMQRAVLTTAALTVNVPLGGTAVTQSQTDTTAGRLLKSGDFGLGAFDPPAVTDLDAATLGAGFYRVNASTVAGTPPPGISLTDTLQAPGFLVVHPRGASGGQVKQTYTQVFDRQNEWYRVRNGTSWSTWRRPTRILGPVAQDGGEAVGAILERGSNANGEFVRFADGSLECRRTNLSTPNANTAQGALFRSADVAWTFPATFADAPMVTGSVDDLDAWATNGTPTTTAVTLSALSAVTKGMALTIRARAYGRWF